MDSIDVIGIGLSTVDVIIRNSKLPTWENPDYFDDITIDSGGPSGTAICTAAKFGVSTGFIGTAGNDWWSEYKLKSFLEHDVDVSQIVKRKNAENQIVTVYVDKITGERIFTTKRNFYSHPLQINEINREYITQAEYLLIDGYHLSASIIAAKWMHQKNKKVIYDGAATQKARLGDNERNLVSLTDYLICGAGYAQALTGYRDLNLAANATLELGPKLIVITEGKKGSHLFSKECSFHTPAFDVEVVDTTGAGDTFHGAFIYGLLQRWDYQKICVFSSAVSAIECMSLGGRKGLPTLKQVTDFLKFRDFDV